jgi:hypothetical protein
MTHTINTPSSNTTYTATFKSEVSIPSGEGITPIGGASGASESIAPVDDHGEPSAGAPVVAPGPTSEPAPPPQPEHEVSAPRASRVLVFIQVIRRWSAGLQGDAVRYWFDGTPSGAFSRFLRAAIGSS